MAILVCLPLGRADLVTARKNYDNARFEDVVKQLRDADFSTLERSDASSGLFMLGMSELALGNDAMSQRAFIRMFSDDPDFEPPQSSKKAMAAMDRAKKQVVMAIRTDIQGTAVRVCGTALPRRSQIKIVFTTATGEEGSFATPDDRCFSTAPAKPESVTGYYVTVSVDGDVRATAGSRAWPLAYERGKGPVAVGKKETEPGVVAKADDGTPWYKHWLTWTIAGVVAAGAITTAVVVVSVNNARSAPGTIEVQIFTPTGSTP